MIKHRHRDGSEYWQFPGGGLNANELSSDAAIRELEEETGLSGTIVRELFTVPYKHGLSTTFLVHADPEAKIALGIDPEDLDSDHKKLVAVEWKKIDQHRGNPEIEELLATL